MGSKVFLGRYEHSIDAKGRVVLPSRYRAHLSQGCVLTIGPDTCLYGYTLEEWRKVAQRLTELRISDPSRRDGVRRIFSLAHEDTPDPQGRVLVPEYLRREAGLERDVYVTGQHDHFEIWDKQSFDRRVGERPSPGAEDLPL